MLTQRTRERIQLFPPLTLMPQREKTLLQCHLKTKLPQVDILLFYFLCLSLSIFLTYSHCLWIFFGGGLLTPSPDMCLILINPVYDKQKTLGLEVCARTDPHHRKNRFFQQTTQSWGSWCDQISCNTK